MYNLIPGSEKNHLNRSGFITLNWKVTCYITNTIISKVRVAG